MLKITPGPKGRQTVIPSNLTTLSVSWLNSQFKAMAVHRGVVEGTWERPGDIEGSGNFEALVREAVQKTGYRGMTVSLLLGHPRLAQQLSDVPPVQGSALAKLVQRQAQQQKMFDGEAAWAFQQAVSGKGSQRIILHLFPKLLLNQLVQGAQKNDLHLVSVLPPTAVLHGQLAQLPLEKDEIALLAGETGGSTTVVVGRSDGQVLLARTLTGNWNDSAGRLAVDLNRTILFVNQQYGLAVNSVWLFGPGATEKQPEMQGQMQIPVKVSPVEHQPLYWATEAVKLSPALAPNFISLDLQKAPQRMLLSKVAAVIAAVVVIASLLVSSYLFMAARQEEKNIGDLKSKVTTKEAEHKQLQQQEADLARKRDMVKLVVDNRPAPVPGWFLGYLSEAVPNDLVVTNLQIKQEEDLWRVEITGTSQVSTKPVTPAAMSNSVALFMARLVSGPFHMRAWNGNAPLTESAAEAKEGGASFATWVAKLTSAPTPAKPAVENQFVIQGIMR